MDNGELLDGAAVRPDDRVIAMSDLCEGEFDSSGEFEVGNRLGLWEYFCLLKSLDPITRRDILGLQASNFLLKLRILRLECRDKFSQLRIFVLECRYGLRRFPRFHLEPPNGRAG